MKNINDYILTVKVGDFVAKKNLKPFRISEGFQLPLIKIETLVNKNKGSFYVNNNISLRENEVNIITQEKADELFKVWDSCIIYDVDVPKLNTSLDHQCKRQDTGEYKVKYPIKGFKSFNISYCICKDM